MQPTWCAVKDIPVGFWESNSLRRVNSEMEEP